MEIDNRAKKAHKVIIDEDGKRKYFYGPQKYRKQWQLMPELRGKEFVWNFYCFVINLFGFIFADWCRASTRSNCEAFCIVCERHLKANRKSLINHSSSKLHLESLRGGPIASARRSTGAPRGRPARFKVEESIIPDNDPLYDEDVEDGEILGDGSMAAVSGYDDDDLDASFMVTEVDPHGHMNNDDDDEDEYEENGHSGFSVPSHIANGSSVSVDLASYHILFTVI